MTEHMNTGAVAAAIPFGRENAISRAALAQKLGMSDRKMRDAVEDARLDGLIIINTQNGGGYFQTTDLDEMKRQYAQDTARAMSILRRRKPLREALIAAGIRVDGNLAELHRDAAGRFVEAGKTSEQAQIEQISLL